jgi:hypothetical protein
MPPSIRQQLLESLGELSELAPDVRLGQLIANLSYSAIAPTEEAIWGVDDQQLLTAVRDQIERLSASTQASR